MKDTIIGLILGLIIDAIIFISLKDDETEDKS